jgi:hypothetical protein
MRHSPKGYPGRSAALVGFLLALLSASPLLAADHTAAQQFPIQFGTTGGNARDETRNFCCGGTLGALVLLDGIPQVLSNNHVIARAGLAAPGEAIIDPGLIDNNCSTGGARRVAVFHRNWVPLGQQNVDVAVARALRGKVDPSGTIMDLGVPCTSVEQAAVGMTVTKSGRTTGVTTGTVQAIDAQIMVDYRPHCGTGAAITRSYDNQLIIVPAAFSAPGDSGSLVVSTGLHPVGLLYAGSDTTTVAHPFQDVIDAFAAAGHSFSLVGAECASSKAEETVAGPQGAAIEAARAVKRKHQDALFTAPGVLGVGVGKVDDDPATTEAAIVVYVDAASAFPPSLPEALDGFRVRVVPTGRFVAR